MQVKNVLNLAALIVLCCAVAHAGQTTGEVKAKDAEVKKSIEDQWFDLRFVGQEIVEQKQQIFLTPEIVLELFQKTAPQFKPDWLNKLGQPIEPTPGARKIPEAVLKQMREVNGESHAQVVGFSKRFAQIMILQTKGNYLWHHFQACQADFKVARTEKLDKIFGLKELEKIYSFRCKGIGYGSTPDEVTKALGKPDGNETFQSEEFYRCYYLQDDVTVEFNEGIIRLLTPNVPDWVKKEIKANGVNVTRH